MPSTTARNITAAVVAVAILAALFILPQMWAVQAERNVAQAAAQTAARDAAQRVAQDEAKRALEESAHNAAKQAGADLVNHATAQIDIAPAAPAPPRLDRIVVERKAFRISLPGGSSVDPADPDVGSERLVTANTSGKGVMIFRVEDVEKGREVYEAAVEYLRRVVEDPEDTTSTTFNSVRTARSTAFTGRVKGHRTVWEIAQSNGENNTVLIILEYPVETQDRALRAMRSALATFTMKDESTANDSGSSSTSRQAEPAPRDEGSSDPPQKSKPESNDDLPKAPYKYESLM